MAIPAHRIRYSYAEYLALEGSSNVKHEFLDGQMLVSHARRHVDVWTRDGGTWVSRSVPDGETAVLASIRAHLDVGELYAAAAEPRAEG
jgi:hypothetical protein